MKTHEIIIELCVPVTLRIHGHFDAEDDQSIVERVEIYLDGGITSRDLAEHLDGDDWNEIDRMFKAKAEEKGDE